MSKLAFPTKPPVGPQGLSNPPFAQLCAFVRRERQAHPDQPLDPFLAHLVQLAATLKWQLSDQRLWQALTTLFLTDSKAGRRWSFIDPYWDQPPAPAAAVEAPKPTRAIPSVEETRAYLWRMKAQGGENRR